MGDDVSLTIRNQQGWFDPSDYGSLDGLTI